MNLVNISALVTGIFVKLYDDIVDNNVISNSSTIMYTLKALLIIFLTILVMNDIYAAFIFTITSLVCLYLGDADNNFWRFLALIPMLALIINYKQVPELVKQNIGYKIILLVIGLLFLFLEPKVFPEEKSTKKTIFRIGLVIVAILCLYINTYPDFQFIIPINYFLLGYFSTNLVFQNLVLNVKASG